MPAFQPFPGVRYATSDGRLDDLLAPPYDVITAAEREVLAARSPHNAVHIELPAEEHGRDRYRVAASLWESWRAGGVLGDDEPSFYVYRMGYHDGSGRPRQTTGVIGALQLSTLDEGDVLPHEHTTPKARADRLDLLRACRANLSPIWVLSTTRGLSELCELPAPPDARGTDADGVHHRLWRVSQPGLVEALATAVAASPVIVADGHHRYETALAYRDERRAATRAASGDYADSPRALAYRDERRATTAGAAGDHDAVMAWVVEARDDQLTVAPTHRLVSGLPDGFDLPGALAAYFDLEPAPAAAEELPARMAAEGALALVTAGEAWLLRPTAATEAATEHDLDSSRLDVALATLPPHTLTFQHGVAETAAEVVAGRAQGGVLLRPATVDQIAEVGRGAARMPAKTTFFTPKPRTGMVFRSVAG